MLESLRQKILELRAKVDEYERLGARLEELERTVSAEIPRLWQLRDHLAKQHREVAGRAAQLGHAGAAGGREAGKRTDAAPAALERMRHQGLLASLESAQEEVSGLLDRLAKLQAPGAASPAVGEEKLLVLEPEDGDAAAAPAAEVPAAEVASPEPHAPEPAEAGLAPHAEADAHGAAEPAAHHAAPHEDEEAAVREAVETGRRVMDAADRCREAFQDILHGGLWHAVVGAVRPHSAGHANIDEARAAARETAEGLRQLRRELADLRERFGGAHGIGDIAALAERLAHLAEGKAEGEPGLRRLPEQLHAVYHDVRSLCAKLLLHANRLRVRRAAAARRPGGVPSEA